VAERFVAHLGELLPHLRTVVHSSQRAPSVSVVSDCGSVVGDASAMNSGLCACVHACEGALVARLVMHCPLRASILLSSPLAHAKHHV